MLKLFFNPVSIKIAVFTVFVPLRWAWRFWLLIAMLITAWLGFSPRNVDPGIGYAFGLSILMGGEIGGDGGILAVLP